MTEQVHGATIVSFPARLASAAPLNFAYPSCRRIAKQLFLSPMPIAPLDVYDIDGSGLSPLTFRMYWRLLALIWVEGSIPDDPARLARASGMTRARWNIRAAELAPLFDRLADGAWVDLRLAAARTKLVERLERAERRRFGRNKRLGVT